MKNEIGNICFAKESYILHQTNCVCTRGYVLGIAKTIFEHYPTANTYFVQFKREPGTCTIHGQLKDFARPDFKGVINLYGQKMYGKPTFKETAQQRLEWFKQALYSLPSQLEGDISLAIPFKIGCNMAGGKWQDYEAILAQFEIDHPRFTITLYHLNKKKIFY